jgi:hypothetical protein
MLAQSGQMLRCAIAFVLSKSVGWVLHINVVTPAVSGDFGQNGGG